MVETDLYPSNYSDIVALLVIEHQVHVQNLITRVNYDVRTALDRDQRRNGLDSGSSGGSVSDETNSLIEDAAEHLVKAMLFAGEAKLTSPIVGSNAFTEQFELSSSKHAGRSIVTADHYVSLICIPGRFVTR
jgi:hypothetical protein